MSDKDMKNEENSSIPYLAGDLYLFSALYHSLWANEVMEWFQHNGYKSEIPFDLHKSRRFQTEVDGQYTEAEGWFVVVIQTRAGQIRHKYPMEHWDKFSIPVKAQANPWDGHDTTVCLERLSKLIGKNN